jgi:hypothetical protein
MTVYRREEEKLVLKRLGGATFQKALKTRYRTINNILFYETTGLD